MPCVQAESGLQGVGRTMDMLHNQYQKEMGQLYAQYQQKRQALDAVEQASTRMRDECVLKHLPSQSKCCSAFERPLSVLV